MERLSSNTQKAMSNKAAHRELMRQRLMAQTSRFYCPVMHLTVPFLAGVGLIVIVSMMLRDVSRWDLLSIPVWFVALNACEWLIHRNLLHHRSWGFYDRHTPEHHALYVRDDMSIRSIYEVRHVLVPIYAVIALFVAAVPIAAVLMLLGLWNIGLFFFASVVTYVLVYEWLHLSYHLPPNRFLNRLRFFRFLQHHHAIHHLPHLMQRWNFNTTVPLWDMVSGTIYSRRLETLNGPIVPRRAEQPGSSGAVIPTSANGTEGDKTQRAIG